MALLSNYSVLNSNPGRKIGGQIGTNIYGSYNPSSWQNFYCGDHLIVSESNKACFPTATSPPYSYILAFKGAELSSTTTVYGTGSISSGLTKGINLSSSVYGSGTLDSNLSLITQLFANLVGSSSLEGTMVGVVQLASNINSSGSLDVSMNLITNMTVTMTGSCVIDANLKGKSLMLANIYVNQSEATVQQIVDGVWNATATEYDVPGTLGNKLNAAGSAGDPWTTSLPSTYPSGTAGYIIGNNLDIKVSDIDPNVMTQLVETGITLQDALKIMVAVLAGKTSIVNLGGGEATVTFRDTNDTTNRITAHMSGSNRTSVTSSLV